MTESRSIVITPGAGNRIERAAADLQRYLTMATGEWLPIAPSASLLPNNTVAFALGHAGDGGIGDALVAGAGVTSSGNAEGYHLRRTGDLVAILGDDEAGAVFGVYALLEEVYGCGFFLGSEVVPGGTQPLLPDTLDLIRSPRFATRGYLPWYDFLSGPTAWNLPEYKLYVDRMVRMGLNFLGLHIYSSGPVNRSMGAEPFLSFTWRGVGHDGYLDTTQTSRWGYQPMRVSEFAYGTDQVFTGEVFGADAAIEAQGPLDAADRAKALLGEALNYAKTRGLRICVGFEPAAIPQEILNALPANAKRQLRGRDGAPRDALDLASVAAQDILRVRLDDLLDTYPQVDAIWLWQNEDAAWANQWTESEILPFDTSYIRAAYDYLNERAPHVQLVVSGWGAVHALFDQMHQELPADIAFSALNHNLGTTETDPVYGRLDGRSRWPIPWLEDDATLWEPQYHIERFRNDIERAAGFGADGMIGIHWRTRTIDHVASYFTRALWQPDLAADTFYRWYFERLAGPDLANALADRFGEIDRSHAWPGYLDHAHVSTGQWAHGHSNEAGAAFNPLVTDDAVVTAFDAFTTALHETAASADPIAADRLRYHAAQAEFARQYVTSQHAAAELDAIVERASADSRTLTAEEETDAVTQLRAIEAAVRAATAAFYAELSTTADLGVLASLSIKYVQRAIWQRYDALRQVLADPSSVPVPDVSVPIAVPRVFVPVPPGYAGTGGVEIEAIVQTPAVTAVTVTVQPFDGSPGQDIPLTCAGRGVWRGQIAPSVSSRYWVNAITTGGDVLRSPVAPSESYGITVTGHD